MIFLEYSDLNEYIPNETGNYMLFLTDGNVITGYWDKNKMCFRNHKTHNTRIPDSNILYWAGIPSPTCLQDNLYKEL